MTEVCICEGKLTPIGGYGGGLLVVRAVDLAAKAISALLGRNPGADWSALDDDILAMMLEGFNFFGATKAGSRPRTRAGTLWNR